MPLCPDDSITLIFIFIYVYACMSCECLTADIRRWGWILWSWNYRKLWAPWPGCWVPLEEQKEISTTEPCLQLEKFLICKIFNWHKQTIHINKNYIFKVLKLIVECIHAQWLSQCKCNIHCHSLYIIFKVGSCNI